MADRDKHIYMAKLAEQAEKYDEMVRSMKCIVVMKMELTVEERNLLSVGYKNVIGSRRASWRTIKTIEEKEAARGKQADQRRLEIIQEYRKEIEKEMEDICNDMLKLLQEFLIPCSMTIENQVFFYKMKGDYCRYLAEFVVTNYDHCNNALLAYKEAADIVYSDEGLDSTHPIRLGLILNFSVFFYEILGDRMKAIFLAREAFEEAIAKMDNLSEECYRDATLIMQLLRDNVTVWSAADNDVEDRPPVVIPAPPESLNGDTDE